MQNRAGLMHAKLPQISAQPNGGISWLLIPDRVRGPISS